MASKKTRKEEEDNRRRPLLFSDLEPEPTERPPGAPALRKRVEDAAAPKNVPASPWAYDGALAPAVPDSAGQFPASPWAMNERPAEQNSKTPKKETTDDNKPTETDPYKRVGVKEFPALYAGLSAEKQGEFKSALQQVRDEYEEQKESLGNRELAERLGKALTQLGAGLYGQRTGQDMSGLKFESTDWEKRLDRALQEFRAKRQGVETDRSAAMTDAAQGAQAAEAARGRTLQAQQLQDNYLRGKQTFEAQQESIAAQRELATTAAARKALEDKREERDRKAAQLRGILSSRKMDDKTISKLQKDIVPHRTQAEIKEALSEASTVWFYGTDIDSEQAFDIMSKALYEDLSAPKVYQVTDAQGNSRRVANLTPEQLQSMQQRGLNVTPVGP